MSASERRAYSVAPTALRSAPGAPGRPRILRVRLICPFCQQATAVGVRALYQHGTRCRCGALLTETAAFAPEK